jgi:hypothetical protein
MRTLEQVVSASFIPFAPGCHWIVLCFWYQRILVAYSPSRRSVYLRFSGAGWLPVCGVCREGCERTDRSSSCRD